jgi:hypothetical protein
MKKRFNGLILLSYVFLLIGAALVPANATNVTLGVPVRTQEHSQWCWDASSKAELDHYGTNVSQCTIANWAFTRSDCCGNTVFDWNHACNQPNTMSAMQAVMGHWGVSSTIRSGALSWATVKSEINARRPFTMAFYWTSGGGHALAGYGYDDAGAGYVNYMDPWPGHGYTKSLYSTAVSASDHTWGNSLQLTTTPSATASAQVTSLWTVTGAQAGKTSALWAQVKNTGSAALPSDALVWFYVTGPNWTNYWVGSASVSGLGAGSTAWYAYNWPIPSSATAGTYTYWARVYRGSTAISSWSSSQSFTVTGSSSQKAVMTSPVNGSTLTSTTQTFVWTNVGAPQYWLYVGTTPGANNMYSKSMGTATSITLNGLPSDGRMIYVRLWTLSGSTWLYNDYSYRAYSGGSKAVMTSPANGSTLTSTTQTFVWTNVGASQYWLYLGTSPGASNIYNQSTGTATSRTVSGLPSNGSMIYARLWTYSGGWQYNDYSYRAYTGSGGFNEQFNGSAANWIKDSGSWSIVSSAYYYTAGRPGYSDTSTYNQAYTNLDYSARLWRSGTATTSANRLIFGASGAIGSDGHFSNEYTFNYTTGGMFSIYKRVGGGVNTAMIDWTANSAINKGNAWNTLRVKIFGSSLYFYINGTLVASGTDTGLTSGRVGVGMYRDTSSTGNGFWVDWATLTIPSSLALEDAIDQDVFNADVQDEFGHDESPVGDINGTYR